MFGFLANARNTTINGGIFVNNGIQGPWDRLQAAASPSAFFNSGDELDAPKCHPNTRVAILDALRDFALSQGGMAVIKALWLNGPAGAGKSAIARSLCEELHTANALLASYFFKRTDGSRNTHNSFVATITYQIYRTLPEHYRLVILAVIQDDPLIFTRSLTTQWESLIMIPLRELFETNYFHAVGRRLIVIDGLDECSTALAQVSILEEIQRISLVGSPFLFIVASRPEHDIQSFFLHSSWKSPRCLLYRLDLEASYESNEDIRRFIVDKLHELCRDHPHKQNIPAGWPPGHAIQALVDKASGLFIYASLAIAYVASNRHQPHKRLDVVLGLRHPNLKGDLPFAELDTLYNQILSSCQDVNLALEIISFTSLSNGDLCLELFANLNALDIDDCIAALDDLRSLLHIRPLSFQNITQHQVVLIHKSLADYLNNSHRSDRYYRDENEAICKMAEQFLKYTSDPRCFSTEHWYDNTCISIPQVFEKLVPRLLENIHVSQHVFMSLSLQDWNVKASKYWEESQERQARCFYDSFWALFQILIQELRQLATTDHKNVYDYYRAQFRDLNAALPSLCLPQNSEDCHAKSNTFFTWRRVWNVKDAILVMFISYYPDFPMPQAYTKLMLSSDTQDEAPITFCIRKNQVDHDTALQCLDLIRSKSALYTEEDASVLRATLQALIWTLPEAKFSLELYSACTPLQLRIWCTPLRSRLFQTNGIVEEEIEKAAKFVEIYRLQCAANLGIVDID